jgi:hypothetical protein
MGYRGKVREREEARRLRAEGKTLLEIATTLHVSESSASIWVRDVPHLRRDEPVLIAGRNRFGSDGFERLPNSTWSAGT